MFSAQLITYSPLHIGDGGELIPFEYIISEYTVEGKKFKKLKVYPFDYFTEELCRKYKEEELLPKLIVFKEVAKEGLGLSLEEFLNRAKVNGIDPKYKISIKNFSQGKNIKTFIKTLEGPYIPGSEVKGALRTVFMYNLFIENQKLRAEFFNSLDKVVPSKDALNRISKQEKREILKKLNNVFQKFEEIFMRAGQKDAQYDLFKSFIVSDSKPFPYKYLYVDEIHTIGSSRENLNEFCEFLQGNKKIELEIQIDENANLKGLSQLKNFGINHKNITKLNWQFIKESACRFYLDLIDAEIFYFQSSKIRDANVEIEKLVEFLKKLKAQIEKCQRSPKCLFPLRLGKFEGFLSLTLMLMVKREKSQLFERIFKLSVPKPRAIPNKTRKVLRDSLPGWCFLYVKM